MTVYCYDKDGYFVGAATAQANPMHEQFDDEPEFLIPSHATSVAPPTPADGQIARWTQTGSGHDDGSWALVSSPAFLAAQSALMAARLVIFYRAINGMDKSVMGSDRYGSADPDGVGIRFRGAFMTDPANADVGAAVFNTDPAGWGAVNANAVTTKKVVPGDVPAIADRDANDIFLDDLVAQRRRLVIFYRNRNGFDKKVLYSAAWSDTVISGQVCYLGKPLTDPANADVAYITSDTLTGDTVDEKNVSGVATKKVNDTSDGVTDRLEADVDKDRDNIAALNQACDTEVAQALSDATGMPVETDNVTHLMIAQNAMFIAMNVDGSHTPQEISDAKDVLAVYKQLYATIQGLRAARDSAIAALESA